MRTLCLLAAVILSIVVFLLYRMKVSTKESFADSKKKFEVTMDGNKICLEFSQNPLDTLDIDEVIGSVTAKNFALVELKKINSHIALLHPYYLESTKIRAKLNLLSPKIENFQNSSQVTENFKNRRKKRRKRMRSRKKKKKKKKKRKEKRRERNSPEYLKRLALHRLVMFANPFTSGLTYVAGAIFPGDEKRNSPQRFYKNGVQKKIFQTPLTESQAEKLLTKLRNMCLSVKNKDNEVNARDRLKDRHNMYKYLFFKTKDDYTFASRKATEITQTSVNKINKENPYIKIGTRLVVSRGAKDIID